jgi:hypothetical protein
MKVLKVVSRKPFFGKQTQPKKIPLPINLILNVQIEKKNKFMRSVYDLTERKYKKIYEVQFSK